MIHDVQWGCLLLLGIRLSKRHTSRSSILDAQVFQECIFDERNSEERNSPTTSTTPHSHIRFRKDGEGCDNGTYAVPGIDNRLGNTSLVAIKDDM